jgi:transcriptional repressor NrdR
MVCNSRPTQGDSQIWRRRKCENCGGTFTTYERAELSHLIVVKKSGRRQKYSRAKLFAGIYHSTIDKKGVDRGDMSQLSEEITNLVEKEITDFRKKEITSFEILEAVLRILKKRAPDALLRFVAYKEGNDKKKMKMLIEKHFI